MNISELVNIIKDIALQQMPVHSSFDGDVYENWDSKEIKYGSVNVALQSITYDGNLCTYSLILYYGDRLLQDKRNVNLIYSDGVVALQSIINTLESDYGVDIPQSVIYTPFEQNFADYLAGVYATFDVMTESELGYCSIAEMEMDEDSDSDSDSDSESDVPVDAFMFTANAESTIGLSSLSSHQTLEYSVDEGATWNAMDTSTTIDLESGSSVYIRGQLSGYNLDSDYTQFTMTGSIAASGNINYIWDYTNPKSTTLSYNHCGYRMFANCTALTTPPELPATTLSQYCYAYMFAGCTGLTSVPELPATTLEDSCYRDMFYGCTSLTSAPELPATTLSWDCYREMFQGCSSLTSAPELPATTLTDYCYSGMFYGCTSLTDAPELPATTLVDSCYYNMFSGCTSLNYIKCLATDISASDCTTIWVRNVAATGTFVKDSTMSDWETGNSGIPTDWEVIDNV